MATESLNDSLRDTLAFFDESAEPRTTTEVAGHLDLGRRTAYNRLDRLVELDELDTKKVGASARVWWRPTSPPMAESAGESGTENRFVGDTGEFELLVDAVDEYAIFRLDPQGHVQTWNPGAERIKGYRAEEIVGEHISTFYIDEDRASGVPEEDLEAATEGGSVQNEGWRVRGNGSSFWANVTITAIRDEAGDLTGFAKVTCDMTDRRAYERRLAKQAERLEHQRDDLKQDLDDMFERVDDAFYALDDEFRFEYVNERAAKHFGASEHELHGRVIWEALDIDDDDPLIDRYHMAMDTQEPTSFDRYSEPLGIWTNTRVYPGKSGLSVNFTDITERKERERELEQYEAIVETINDGVYTVDSEGRFTMVNGTYAEMTGYSREELLGSHVSLVVDDDVVETAQQREQNLLAGEPDRDVLEATIRSADGERLPAEATFALLPGSDGTHQERVGVVRDISERKQAEEELRKSEERFRTLMAHSPFSMQIFEAEGRPIATNPAWERLWDASRDELVDYNILKDEQLEAAGLLTHIRDALDGEVVTLPIIHYDPAQNGKSGRARWIEGYVYPLLSEDEETVEVALVHHDVTERKEREWELEQYETIVETVTDGVYAVDREYRFTMVNQAYTDMVGYDRETILGSHISTVVGDDVASFGERLREDLLEGTDDTGNVEFAIETATGESITVETRYAMLPSDGDFVGTAGVVRDVSERKARERELLEFQRWTGTLIENFPVGAVALVDDELQILTFAGTPVTEMTVAQADLQGRYMHDVVAEEIRDVVIPGYEVALDGEPTEFEETIDGRVYQFNFVPVRDDAGGVFAATAMSRDVTEQKEREQEFREAKLKMEAATDAGAVGTWEWNVREDRVVAGPSLARMFGVAPDVAQEGVPLDRLVSAIHEDDRDRVARSIDEAVSSCGEYEEEYRVRNADGEVRWVVARGHVQSDDDGDPLTFPGALTDITERKQTERRLEHQREELTALNSLNEVAQRIVDSVIEQSTREEIEAALCAGLTETNSFSLAWIGDVNSTTQTLDLRTESGDEGYIDGLTISVDPKDDRSQGPMGQAFITREVSATRDIQTDLQFAPWRDRAASYGIQSSAGVPIQYDGRIYGVLGVYAERLNAFGEPEQNVLGQLGEVVGHAIAAVERKQALMSDEVIELEFYLEDVFSDVSLESSLGGHITFDQAVPASDEEFLVYGMATEEAWSAFNELVTTVPHWKEVSELGAFDGKHRFELRVDESPVLSTVASLGGYIETARIEEGDIHLVAHLPPTGDVRAIKDAVNGAYPPAKLMAQRQISRTDEAATEFDRLINQELTDRQRTALKVAFMTGYFEWPRDTTGEEVADSIGVSPPTFHQHLRKAERKVLQAVLSTGA